MKIFIEKDNGSGFEKKSEESNLSTANTKLLKGERIHLCYHDEEKGKPCRVIMKE